MTKEQETIKYLSAMRVIDFDKLGFVYGKETIDDVLKLIKQQDKQIDGMAKFIEVFELDKEIAETYCDGTYENCKHKEDIGTCKSCIKQYFQKKTEEI